jgi:predicted TIM-barrel fold metal-dependent hydrolase
MVLPTAGRHQLHERLLDPVWAEAQHLDMSISVHIGWPNPDVTHDCTSPAMVFMGAFETSMWWAYLSVFGGGILDRFPKLRVGFFEADCRWFELFFARAQHWQPTTAASPWPAKRTVKEYLAESPVFFSFEGDFSTLPRFMDLVGDDKVMAAMDFPHTHYGTANLSEALDFVRKHEALSPARKRKLLRDNALKFFRFGE